MVIVKSDKILGMNHFFLAQQTFVGDHLVPPPLRPKKKVTSIALGL
jgi:hypothetical protein